MAFDVTATMAAVSSHLKATGLFSKVDVGEPSQPPDAGTGKPYAALFMRDAEIVELMADGSTVELHIVLLRLHWDAFGKPAERAELGLAVAASKLLSTLLADADLGATVRHLDPAGMKGTRITVGWGYVDIGGKMYRIADIVLPFVVDGSATVTP